MKTQAAYRLLYVDDYTYGKKAKITPKHTRYVLFNFATQCQFFSVTFSPFFLLKLQKRCYSQNYI